MFCSVACQSSPHRDKPDGGGGNAADAADPEHPKASMKPFRDTARDGAAALSVVLADGGPFLVAACRASGSRSPEAKAQHASNHLSRLIALSPAVVAQLVAPQSSLFLVVFGSPPDSLRWERDCQLRLDQRLNSSVEHLR